MIVFRINLSFNGKLFLFCYLGRPMLFLLTVITQTCPYMRNHIYSAEYNVFNIWPEHHQIQNDSENWKNDFRTNLETFSCFLKFKTTATFEVSFPIFEIFLCCQNILWLKIKTGAISKENFLTINWWTLHLKTEISKP